ncbi:prepilin peptidase [bacterium]|nr:prepilin peptidase [bacterium]
MSNLSIIHILLGLILLIAAFTDLRQHKVYNWLTFPGMLLGLGFHLTEQGLPGLWFSLLGLLIGGLLFFPAFFWGGMGAGDIKLMAVIGAFTGAAFVFNVAFYAAIGGGIIAMVILGLRGELWITLKNLVRLFCFLVIPRYAVKPDFKKQPLPFAAVIALGAGAAYLFPPLIDFT